MEQTVGSYPMVNKGACIFMENKKNNAKVFWIILAVLVSVVVALALIIRTEKRLLRFLGKAEKALHLKKQKSDPITVEL